MMGQKAGGTPKTSCVALLRRFHAMLLLWFRYELRLGAVIPVASLKAAAPPAHSTSLSRYSTVARRLPATTTGRSHWNVCTRQTALPRESPRDRRKRNRLTRRDDVSFEHTLQSLRSFLSSPYLAGLSAHYELRRRSDSLGTCLIPMNSYAKIAPKGLPSAEARRRSDQAAVASNFVGRRSTYANRAAFRLVNVSYPFRKAPALRPG